MPSDGSPRRCARADSPRLFARATTAFIDRAPVDWASLLSRVRASPDRDLFHNLSGLAVLRQAISSAHPSSEPSRRARAAAWTVVALASAQTALALVLATIGAASGASVHGRAPQIAIAVAFALSSVRLAFANRDDERCLFLLATFTAIASVFAGSAAAGLMPPSWAPLARTIPLDALVPVCFYQFALNFPRVARFTWFDRLATPIAAILWSAGIITVGVTALAANFGAHIGPFRVLLRDDPSRLFWRVFSLAMAAVVVVIAARTRRAPPDERRRIARLATAIVIGSLPFASLGAARTLMSAVDEWFRRPGAGPTALYAAIIVSLAVTPLASAAAVVADVSTNQNRLGRRRRPRFLSAMLRRPDHDRIASALDHVSQADTAAAKVAAMATEIGDLVDSARVTVWLDDGHGRFVHWSNTAAALPSASGLIALVRRAIGPADVSPGGAWFSLLPRADREWIVANEVELVAGLRGATGLAAIATISGRHATRRLDRRDRAAIKLVVAGTRLDGRDRSHTANRPERHQWRSGAVEATAIECPTCGALETALPLACGCGDGAVPARVPRVVAGRFWVERRIGAGRMGVVYLARDAALDRHVALKTTPALDEGAVSRLRQEAHAMARLNHEALATLYDLLVWRDTPVLVVEWLSGGTLAERVAAGALTPAETVALGIRLARGLAYMHARMVVHRDLKPRNIGLTATGDAKLLDFGLATLTATPRGGFVGTRAYAPPEGLDGAPASPAADRWALAVVMLEALNGENRLAGAAGRRLIAVEHGGLESPSLAASPALRAFFSRALAPRPSARFQTTDEFLHALESVRDDRGK